MRRLQPTDRAEHTDDGAAPGLSTRVWVVCDFSCSPMAAAAEERFMGMATSGIDDDLDDYYERMVGRTIERKGGTEGADALGDQDGSQDGSQDGEDSMDEDGGTDKSEALEMSVGSLSSISMGTAMEDVEPFHPTLRLRPRRIPSTSSLLGQLDVQTRSRGRRAAGSAGRHSAGRRRSHGIRPARSAAELFKQPSANEGAPARVKAQVELKMDSPRDGTAEGYTRGNPMMAALKGGSRSHDFHKSMSHHQLNQLLHSFGMSVTKGQVEKIVSRSYRLSSKSARFSPPRERAPSPTERDFVASVLSDIKGADGSGREWSRVTMTAASKHADAYSVLSEESTQADDYNMERPPMNVIVSSGYRKTALPRNSPMGDLTQPETSSQKSSALMTPSQRAALRKRLKGIGPKALVRDGGRARFDAHQKNAQKGTIPAHEWTVTVAEESGSDLQPYLEAVVFRLSEKLWDQPFVVCEQPPYQLTLGAMNSPLRMCGLPVTVELRLRAGGAFKVRLKLDTAPHPVHQPWNTLAMAPSRKLSFDVVTAQKLQQEKEQRLQAKQQAVMNRQKQDWAAWKATEAKVRAAELSLREEHKKTKEEVQDLRKKIAEEDEHAAAARIQSVHRGRIARTGDKTNGTKFRRSHKEKQNEDDDETKDLNALISQLEHEADGALSQVNERGFLALESEWTKSAIRKRGAPPSNKTAVSEAVSAAVLALLGLEHSKFAAGAPVYSLIDHVRSSAGWETGLPLFLQELRDIRADIHAGQIDAARVRAAHSHLEICVDSNGGLVKSIINADDESAKLVASLCRTVMFTVAYAKLVAEAWDQERAATKIQARQRGIMSRKRVQTLPKTLIGLSDKRRYHVILTRFRTSSQNLASKPALRAGVRPSSAGPHGRTGATLSVTMPEGIQSSRVLIIKAPHGEEIEVILPSLDKEVRGGDVFQVKLEAIDEQPARVNQQGKLARTKVTAKMCHVSSKPEQEHESQQTVPRVQATVEPQANIEHLEAASEHDDEAAVKANAADEEQTARLPALGDSTAADDKLADEKASAELHVETQEDATTQPKAVEEQEVARLAADEEVAVQDNAAEVQATKPQAPAEEGTAQLAADEEAAGTEYICVLRSVIREGCEFTSRQVPGGYLNVGERVFALEEKVANGIPRVRIDRGWVSRKSKSDKFILMSEDEFLLSSADDDGDGIITEHEFRLWHLKFLGNPPGVEELTTFYAADADGNGSISSKEFDAVKPLFLRAKVAQENWQQHVDSAASISFSAQR